MNRRQHQYQYNEMNSNTLSSYKMLEIRTFIYICLRLKISDQKLFYEFFFRKYLKIGTEMS